MNKVIIKYSMFVCFALWSMNVLSELSLEKGSVHRDSSSFSHAQKLKVWDLEDVAAEKGIESIKSVISYFSHENNQYEFVLERELLLAGIDVNNKKIVGPWPLTRWPHTYVTPEKRSTYTDIGFGYEPDDPNINRQNPGPGCLNETPLRYGNLHEMAEDDPILVLFLNNQMMFFSPKYGRVVFSEYYDGGDWLPKEEGDAMRANYHGDTDAQYISNLYTGVDVGMPGYRVYSKLYIQDFDDNDHLDILVWRKVYKSNKKGEAEGFTLLRNEWDHFERNLEAQENSEAGVTGEYLPQDTEEAVVQSWLVDNELTWQKGYPSRSECEGEEGELIPEMHDPLLNDPDVRQ